MKIVVLDGYTLNPGDLSWDDISALGTLVVHDRTRDEDILKRVKDAEIVLTNKTPLCRSLLESCPCLRYIGVLATGYNVVDTEAATELGIVVTNIPAYGTAAVAQFTIALLLELCHHVGAHSDAVHQGEWERCPDFSFWRYPLMELEGRTMGIIGYGRIGRRVGEIARALGLRILAYDPGAKDAQGEALVDLPALLAEGDIISLHCPLTPETAGIINREHIELMRDGTLLINTARGPLLNEQDVADALSAGKLAGVAVDVLTQEPPRADNPLLTAPNCIITPHIAWASLDARKRLMSIAAQNIRAYQQEEPVNVVTSRR